MRKKMRCLIVALAFCFCLFPARIFAADDLHFDFTNGTLTITGSGTVTSDLTSPYADEMTHLNIDGGADGITLGENAFAEAGALREAAFSGSILSIGAQAFDSCTSLAELTFKGNVGEIQENAFAGCSALGTVTVEGSISRINSGAFPADASFTLRIGCGAAADTTSLPADITIEQISHDYTGWEVRQDPDDLMKSIKRWICSRCEAGRVDSLSFSAGNLIYTYTFSDSTLTVFGSGTIDQMSTASLAEGLNTAAKKLVLRPDGGTMSVSFYAFQQFTALQSVTLPDGVTRIEDSAFNGCQSLSELTIPGSVKRIGNSAFSGCNSLTTVVIPDGVQILGNEAFANCSSLISVIFEGDIDTLGGQFLYDCPNLETILFKGRIGSIGEQIVSANVQAVLQSPCINADKIGTAAYPDITFVWIHDPDATEYTTITQPTCTEPGQRSGVCPYCGDSSLAEIPALGHDFGRWMVTRPATYYTEGKERRDCSRCDVFETRTIPRLGIQPPYTPPVIIRPDPQPAKPDGWYKSGKTWYYYDGGEKVKDWLRIKNVWYYLDPKNGAMYDDGLAVIDGVTYYFYDWGGMASTWWYRDPKTGLWYYFRGNGAMAKNSWIEWKHEYYYVGRDGAMLTSTSTPDGYRVDQDGKWIR